MGRSLLLVLFIIFAMVAFVDLANIDRYLYKGICSLLDIFFESNCPDFYDIPFWSLSTLLSAIIALILSYLAIRQSNRQLEVEQEPYVVADGSIVLVGHGRHEVTLKNVGRGSALRITCSTDRKDRDKAFFEDTEPHSYYLSMNDKVESLVSEDAISKIKGNKRRNGYYFYIFYEDQMGKPYMTEVEMKLPDEGGVKLVIMENNRF